MSGAPQMMSSGLSKLKKKHFRVKHQKVKLFRANEPLLSVFMWGVNHTVRRRGIAPIPLCSPSCCYKSHTESPLSRVSTLRFDVSRRPRRTSSSSSSPLFHFHSRVRVSSRPLSPLPVKKEQRNTRWTRFSAALFCPVF